MYNIQLSTSTRHLYINQIATFKTYLTKHSYIHSYSKHHKMYLRDQLRYCMCIIISDIYMGSKI